MKKSDGKKVNVSMDFMSKKEVSHTLVKILMRSTDARRVDIDTFDQYWPFMLECQYDLRSSDGVSCLIISKTYNAILLCKGEKDGALHCKVLGKFKDSEDMCTNVMFWYVIDEYAEALGWKRFRTLQQPKWNDVMIRIYPM